MPFIFWYFWYSHFFLEVDQQQNLDLKSEDLSDTTDTVENLTEQIQSSVASEQTQITKWINLTKADKS